MINALLTNALLAISKTTWIIDFMDIVDGIVDGHEKIHPIVDRHKKTWKTYKLP